MEGRRKTIHTEVTERGVATLVKCWDYDSCRRNGRKESRVFVSSYSHRVSQDGTPKASQQSRAEGEQGSLKITTKPSRAEIWTTATFITLAIGCGHVLTSQLLRSVFHFRLRKVSSSPRISSEKHCEFKPDLQACALSWFLCLLPWTGQRGTVNIQR